MHRIIMKSHPLRFAVWSVMPGLLLSGCIVAQTSTDSQVEPVPYTTVTTVERQTVTTPINASAELVAGEALYTPAQLQSLIGPYALYPDELLAIVLPAATYPLEIVLAARFLEELALDDTLQPDETWDESIVALLNYPEVVQLMNDNIEATWQLGEAVISQQAEVLTAIEDFRQLAYDAGNLQSDENQTVEVSERVIEIHTVEEKVVYVPQYIVEEVIVEQPVPVYRYYPTPRPVYYYPYPAGYSFSAGYFWGVTTAFSIGWPDYHLRVYHPTYRYHPYFGRPYYSAYHYRRPTINVFNSFYVNNSYRRSRDRDRYGSFWRPQRHSSARPFDSRYNRYYTDNRSRDRLSEGRRNRGSYGDYRGQGARPGRTGAADHDSYNPFTALREDSRGGGVRRPENLRDNADRGQLGDGDRRRGGGAGRLDSLRNGDRNQAGAGNRVRGDGSGAGQQRGIAADGANRIRGNRGVAGNSLTAPSSNRANANNRDLRRGRTADSIANSDRAAGAGRLNGDRANTANTTSRANTANRANTPNRGNLSNLLDNSNRGATRTNRSITAPAPNRTRSATPNRTRTITPNRSERSGVDQRRRQTRDTVTSSPRQQTQVRRPSGSSRPAISTPRNQRVSPSPGRTPSVTQSRRQQTAPSGGRRASSSSNRNPTSLNRSQRSNIVQRPSRQPSTSARPSRQPSAGVSRPRSDSSSRQQRSSSSSRDRSRAVAPSSRSPSVRGGARQNRRANVREN